MTTINPTIVSQETIDQAFDRGVRVWRLIHIQSALIDISEPSQDFIDFYDDGQDVQIISDVDPNPNPIITDYYSDIEGVAEYLLDRQEAFLVMVQHQIPTCRHPAEKYEDSCWDASWGYYQSTWLLTNSIESALLFGIAASNKMFVSSWEKAKKEESTQAGAH